MNKFTLDTNCIIDLEENRPNAEHVRKLVQAWKAGQIELAVVAVSASENQKSGTASRDFATFEEKLENVGLSGVQRLLPLAKWDVFYWNHARWSDDEMERLESKIRGILFPNIQSKPPENIEANSTWRNQLCDVLVAWSHAFYKWDYLVTGDENFHDHKNELKKVGVNEVVYPKKAARLCEP
ncbi:MAG: hypothetical protein ACYTEK_15445 [Planctomycetota bacterium]|jgi:hypothetical protein